MMRSNLPSENSIKLLASSRNSGYPLALMIQLHSRDEPRSRGLGQSARDNTHVLRSDTNQALLDSFLDFLNLDLAETSNLQQSLSRSAMDRLSVLAWGVSIYIQKEIHTATV